MKTDDYNNLICSYRKEIINFLQYNMNCNFDLAEDLAQSTILKAYAFSLTTDVRPSSVKSWLYTIARNLYINWYRKSKSSPILSTDLFKDDSKDCSFNDLLSDEFTYEKFDSQMLFYEAFQESLDFLKNKNTNLYNTFIDSIEMEDYDTIASERNLPIGTVKSRVHRAKKIIQQYFSEKGLTFNEF